MQHLAELSHTPAVEAARVKTREQHVAERGAQQSQRERLRLTSVLDGHRQHFDLGPDSTASIQPAAGPPPPKASTDPTPNRSALLSARLEQKPPMRFDWNNWAAWRDESIALLQDAYPNTPLRALYEWVVSQSHPKGQRRLSALAILGHVRRDYPQTEIDSVEELRKILKCLSIHWSNLHSNYYWLVHKRRDVILHRSLYLPYALLCHEDPRVYFAVGDGSFFHENELADHAWCARAEKDGDMIEGRVGVGRRVNVFEFITKAGIIRHPDGKSAGTQFYPNEIQGSKEFLVALKRGCEAIQAAARAQGSVVSVLLLDGARTQKTMPQDAINPNDMNQSDGGKNRKPMRTIGLKGCRRVLEEELGEMRVKGMSLVEMRQLLWQWNRVLAQLTEAEELCHRYGIALMYNPKGHPELSAIEKFWRLAKFLTQDLLDIQKIREAYLELLERYMAPGPEEHAHLEKWFSKCVDYLHYYGGGGEDFIRGSELMPEYLAAQPPNRVRRARLQPLAQLSSEIHKVNIVLIQGKKYPENPQPWGKD